MSLWGWLFGDRKEMFIRDWNKRMIPDEHVEETRSLSPDEKLEAHIELIRQIPRDPPRCSCSIGPIAEGCKACGLVFIPHMVRSAGLYLWIGDGDGPCSVCGEPENKHIQP